MNTPKYRHEIKHFINYSDYLQIRNRLKHIASIDTSSTSNGRYKIRSLYFDNLYDKVLMEKINGFNKREKFRIRFYNNDTSFIRLERMCQMQVLPNIQPYFSIIQKLLILKLIYLTRTINDNNYGLYLAIEGLQESYLERNYGYEHGNSYKAEGTGTNLKYTGETQSNYSGLKDNAVTSITDDDFQKIIDMIKNLNNGTNLVQKEQVAIYLPYIFLLMSLQAPTCQIAHY
ncbi:MAG: VTC domain-containing protein [Clostridium paraputrificum]